MESFHFNIYWQNYFDNLSSVDHDLTDLLDFRSFLIFVFLQIMKCTYIHTYIYIHMHTYIHTHMCVCTLFLCGSEEQRKQQILFKDIPVYSVFIQH